ncbi:MAG: hypothetical protein FJX66_01705 [Alphaproteobacteria bacterium]|nr:hypothetical protein [Alphaproteobacteria bacterium]
MTEREDLDHIAAEYVLGLTGGLHCERIEARLKSEPALAERVNFWRLHLAPLDGAATPAMPSADTWTRLKARIAAEPKPGEHGPITIREAEGAWEQHSPGVQIKLLNVDAASGARSYLLKIDPGSEVRAHEHLVDEECYMISGEAMIGDLHLRAGDYHLIPRHLRHPITRSEKGALVFVRGKVA